MKYDYASVGADYAETLQDKQMSPNEIQKKTEEWLQENAPEDYCLRQVLKMCEYMQQIRKMEILRLKADFYVDANDKIWFFYATDILVRPKKQSVFEV